jgi:hypothetical protein
MWFNGERVKVIGWGEGAVIRDEGPVLGVWVKLDCGDNPVRCLHRELTTA